MAMDSKTKQILKQATSKGLNREFFLLQSRRRNFVATVKEIQADKYHGDRYSVDKNYYK